MVASLCSSFALKWIFDPIMGGGATVPSCGYAQAFALEFIISFNLMFVLTAVATDTRAVSSSFLFVYKQKENSIQFRSYIYTYYF